MQGKNITFFPRDVSKIQSGVRVTVLQLYCQGLFIQMYNTQVYIKHTHTQNQGGNI